MSEQDVIDVFGPQYVQDALEYERACVKGAEQIVLALRRKLRAADPALPNEYDGIAWHLIESEFYEARGDE